MLHLNGEKLEKDWICKENVKTNNVKLLIRKYGQFLDLELFLCLKYKAVLNVLYVNNRQKDRRLLEFTNVN